MADPYRYFRIEAAELTEALQAGLLELEQGGNVQAALSAVLRHAHTLKGAARVVRHETSATLAHTLEDLLVPVREGTASLSPALVSRALAVVDSLKKTVIDLQTPIEPAPPAEVKASSDPVAIDVSREPVDPRHGSTSADREEVNRLLSGTAALGSQLARLRTVAAHLGRARTQDRNPARLRLVEHPTAGRQGLATKDQDAEPWLRELALAEHELDASIEGAARELVDLREGLERLRLVEVEGLRHTLARTVRDAALGSNKRVRFEFHGGGLRVDPELYAAAARGLLQAVKNAVAHGIEPANVREKLGKPATGRIQVNVTRQGSNLLFSCEDDGQGLDLEALRTLVHERQGAGSGRPDDSAVIEAMLGGGVSTAASVTPIAGRGIGLDLVREAVASVGGTLRLDHRPGQGVALTLVAKATLAALPALLVEARDVAYAIPTDAVLQTTRCAVGTASGQQLAPLADGRLAAFFPLSTLVEPDVRPPAGRASWTVVLLEGPERVLALGVDRLLGTKTVVTEPVPEGTRTSPGLSGVARDADGTPRFLLDPAWLHAAAGTRADPVDEEPDPALPILVIDDSLTTRMLERSVLESAGYEVDLATSGEEGLERARARRYALFLVDVEMPGMDGFTFIETIMSDAELRTVPAVLVTSRNSPEDRARGTKVGARAHIVKSEFDQVALLELISKLVSKP